MPFLVLKSQLTLIPPRSVLPGVLEVASMVNVQHLRRALASLPSGILIIYIEVTFDYDFNNTDCKFSVERDVRSQVALVEGTF